jgi:hypothetical protein
MVSTVSTDPGGSTQAIAGFQTFRWAGAYNSPNQASGNQWSESAAPAAWYDYNGGAFYTPCTIVTGWVNIPEVVGGYSRVSKVTVMGDHFTAHDTAITYLSNYAAASGQSASWTDATIPSATPEELDLRPTNQTSHAFQVSIVDTTPTGGGIVGSGQGCSFAAISLEYLPEPGIGKFISAAQQG